MAVPDRAGLADLSASPGPAERTILGSDPRFVRHLLGLSHAFDRADDAPDGAFYREPRVVPHLDSTALATAERLVESLVTEEEPAVLDLMASWDSHLPRSLKPGRVAGLGLNPAELEANEALTERVVHDLNADPSLPFQDRAFDLVLNVSGVEYLTDPVGVFREVGRVLKPGGLFLVVFTNRWFPPKVVWLWENASERERLELVEEYMIRAGAFDDADCFISMGLPRPRDDRHYDGRVPGDPVFAVFAEKAGGPDHDRTTPRDRARPEVDHDAVEERKRQVAETLVCPHCQRPLSKWEVPDDPAIDWNSSYLYICFNDACPFVVRGWRVMWDQGVSGTSYRFLFDPGTGSTLTVPIRGLDDLKPGIVPRE